MQFLQPDSFIVGRTGSPADKPAELAYLEPKLGGSVTVSASLHVEVETSRTTMLPHFGCFLQALCTNKFRISLFKSPTVAPIQLWKIMHPA